MFPSFSQSQCGFRGDLCDRLISFYTPLILIAVAVIVEGQMLFGRLLQFFLFISMHYIIQVFAFFLDVWSLLGLNFEIFLKD